MANYTKTVFGSDWVVASPDVRLGIVAAIARQSANFPSGFDLSESVSIESVLKSYTVHAAYAMFKESKLGTIKEGFLADVVIWSDNLIQLATEQSWNTIKQATVVTTIVGGKIVHQYN